MLSEFSNDGSYYAQLTTDSKLKIWETSTNKFVQEFTPDFQLTSPCTCLQFVQDEVKSYKPSKKKKRLSRDATEVSSLYIALGTASGNLLFYSISKADLAFKINSQTNQSVGCLSWNSGTLVFSGIDQNVVAFNIEKESVASKWKSGNEKLTSILCIPKTRNLLTASRDIKLWDYIDHQLLKTFTGHSHEVIFLRYISPPNENADAYFLSGSKGDRLLSVWNLNVTHSDKNAIANFLLEDIPRSASVYTHSGVSNLVAVTRSGAAQIYQHTLNGKCIKPLKPDMTIHIAAEETQTESTVTKIPILCTKFVFNTNLLLLVGHGSEIQLTFENADLQVLKRQEKVQCWIRKAPWLTTKLKDQKVTNVHRPVVDNNVHYLTPYNSQPPASVKRKITNDGPMDKRLENLTLNFEQKTSKTIKVNNLAHLLMQGLHSKDETILQKVLTRQDENVIKNTLRRLPITVLSTLVEQIAQMIKGKTMACEKGVLWLKHFIPIHAGLLISNPELLKLLGPINGSIEHRISYHQSFLRLEGRLDLLIPQINNKKEEEEIIDTDEFLLVYTDKIENDENRALRENMKTELMDEDMDYDEEEEDYEVNDSGDESSDEDRMM